MYKALALVFLALVLMAYHVSAQDFEDMDGAEHRYGGYGGYRGGYGGYHGGYGGHRGGYGGYGGSYGGYGYGGFRG